MHTTPPADTGFGRPAPLGHVAAFDGLRGLAVAAVVAYHLGLSWVPGGFLGVSAFFTLSGFLICRLLLDEHARTGAINLRSFWIRRARRLLPASLLTLGIVGLLAPTLATDSQARVLPGDLLASLGQVANWRLIERGSTYGSLWQTPSPLQHFWSLAVEEQVYILFPLLVAGVFAIARRTSRSPHVVLIGVLVPFAGASIAAGWLVGGHTRAYFGSDTRLAEVVIGAIAAALAFGQASRRATSGGGGAAPARGRWLGAVRGAGLVLLLGAGVLAWLTVGLHSPVLPRGGFAVHALATAALLMGLGRPGVAAAALSFAPLRSLGRISYGVYLFHWPILVWLTPARAGLDGAALQLLQVTLTLALAGLSLRLIEAPIRGGVRLQGMRGHVAVAGAAAAVVSIAVLSASLAPTTPPSLDWGQARGLIAPPTSERGATAEGAVAGVGTVSDGAVSLRTGRAPAPDGGHGASATAASASGGAPVRLYIGGDSNAYGLGLALQRWAEGQEGVEVWVDGRMACHVVRSGTYRYAGVPKDTEAPCNDWATNRIPEIGRLRPDVALLLFGAFDVLDRRLPGRDWEHVGQERYDAVARAEIAALSDAVLAQGTRLAWATYPAFRTGVRDGALPPVPFPESDPQRMTKWNAMLAEAVTARPGASLVDLRGYLQSLPGGELDLARRPDGLHPTEVAADQIAGWLGPVLVQRARTV